MCSSRKPWVYSKEDWQIPVSYTHLNLYLGNYYVKESTPSEGYLLDEEEHDVVCDYEGDLVAEVSRSTTSAEQVTVSYTHISGGFLVASFDRMMKTSKKFGIPSEIVNKITK